MSTHSPLENLLLIGNGAVEGGWDAVLESIGIHLGEHEQSGRDGIEYFAPLVYFLRSLHLHFTRGRLANKPLSPEMREHIGDAVKRWKDWQSKIAEGLKDAKAKDRIRLRDYRAIGLPELLGKGRTVVVTTNWDTLLQDDPFFSQFEIIPVHGSVTDPSSLYLPMEQSLELHHDHVPESWVKISEAHSRLFALIAEAKQVVVWGWSLSPHDAELAVLVAEVIKDLKQNAAPEKKYVVIDPCRLPKTRLEYYTGRAVTHIQPKPFCHSPCCQTKGMLGKFEDWISDKTGWLRR